jgi:hypothetical protein
MEFSQGLEMGRAAGRRLHKVMTPVTVAHNPPAALDIADMTAPHTGQPK